MGLTRDGIAFLITAQRLGAKFDRTLTLGRQGLFADRARLKAAFADNDQRLSTTEAQRLVSASGGYAESLLDRLGARSVESLDANDYEQSTMIHDLNEPLPASLHNKFTLVLDGGTLEHVFNYPAALSNVLDTVGMNGHFIAINPCDGHVGHGFYQLSPELLYRGLTGAHGFRVVCMLIKPLHWRSRWRLVPDPAQVGGRVVWRSTWPANLYVLAQRVDEPPVLDDQPIQSDYLKTWTASAPFAARPMPMRKAALRSCVPLPVKEIRESAYLWRASKAPLAPVKLTELGLADSGVPDQLR